MKLNRHVIGIIVLLFVLFIIIFFLGVPKPPAKPDHKDFPKELTEPCVDKTEGDVCVVENFESVEESHCEYVGEQLVCFPHRLPPPEQI